MGERKVRIYKGIEYCASTIKLSKSIAQDIRDSARARGLLNKDVFEQAYSEYITTPGSPPGFAPLNDMERSACYGGQVRSDYLKRMDALAINSGHRRVDLERAALLNWLNDNPSPARAEDYIPARPVKRYRNKKNSGSRTTARNYAAELQGQKEDRPHVQLIAAVYSFCPHCGKPLPKYREA